MNFVAAMVNQGLKQQTINGYLSAVRHLQIECGGGDPRVENMPLLELALRGGTKGTGRCAHKGPATDNTSSAGEAAAQLESGPSQPAACHAMGRVLCCLFWVPEVWGTNSSRVRRV